MSTDQPETDVHGTPLSELKPAEEPETIGDLLAPETPDRHLETAESRLTDIEDTYAAEHNKIPQWVTAAKNAVRQTRIHRERELK